MGAVALVVGHGCHQFGATNIPMHIDNTFDAGITGDTGLYIIQYTQLFQNMDGGAIRKIS